MCSGGGLMRRFLTKSSYFLISLLAFTGLFSIKADATINNSAANIVMLNENTPLYLTHANNSNLDANVEMGEGWHYSHRSHASHYSHESHYSHYSAR